MLIWQNLLNRPLVVDVEKMYVLNGLFEWFSGLKCSSALFRHEIAYVLGQIQHEACVKQLTENLQDTRESPMVRHECAEALGKLLIGQMY